MSKRISGALEQLLDDLTITDTASTFLSTERPQRPLDRDGYATNMWTQLNFSDQKTEHTSAN